MRKNNKCKNQFYVSLGKNSSQKYYINIPFEKRKKENIRKYKFSSQI